MIKKLKKLVLSPKRYFYDYFRKKLGFRKYFVTDKIRLLDSVNHQKWIKLLFSHPYLYFYYKLNKRLRNPSYPILVDYRIENIHENGMGGGKRTVLAVELERNNIIYFTDPRIVQDAADNKDPNLAGAILRCNFLGSGNKVFLNAGVKVGRDISICFRGSTNTFLIDNNCNLSGGLIELHGNANKIEFGPHNSIESKAHIIFRGNNNTLHTGNACCFMRGSRITYLHDDNYVYIGPDTKISEFAKVGLNGSNSLCYICGGSKLNLTDLRLNSDSIFFYGFGSTVYPYDGKGFYFAGQSKNILIGSDCMFGNNLFIRNFTGHSMYDGQSKKRISNPESIIIGDHVWINMGSRIFRGSKIKSGTVIGANSFVTNKEIPEKCVVVGAPAKVIRENILWGREAPPDNAKTRELSLYDTYKRPEKLPTYIGWDRLTKINAIEPSMSAAEKLNRVHNILEKLDGC